MRPGGHRPPKCWPAPPPIFWFQQQKYAFLKSRLFLYSGEINTRIRGKGGEGRDKKKGKEGRGKRKGGEGKGAHGWEGKFRGSGGEGKGVGKRGGEGKFRGARPPQIFFPRTAPEDRPTDFGRICLKILLYHPRTIAMFTLYCAKVIIVPHRII